MQLFLMLILMSFQLFVAQQEGARLDSLLKVSLLLKGKYQNMLLRITGFPGLTLLRLCIVLQIYIKLWFVVDVRGR